MPKEWEHRLSAQYRKEKHPGLLGPSFHGARCSGWQSCRPGRHRGRRVRFRHPQGTSRSHSAQSSAHVVVRGPPGTSHLSAMLNQH